MNLFRSKTTASLIKNSIILTAFTLTCVGLPPTAQAVSPPQDGGYPGNNTAEGTGALQSLTTGHGNTANGYQALNFNTTGSANTADGFLALSDTISGFSNTAVGYHAGGGQTASENTAVGATALAVNYTGNQNTAVGVQALTTNNNGAENTAVGFHALRNNFTGHDNTALRWGAGQALTTGSNNIDIGNPGVAGGESATIRIGFPTAQFATFIAGISGTAISGTAVVVNTAGQLGVLPSSARFKDEIKPMDKASEAIFALKPVTFHYKNRIDPDRTAQFGLVAEDVEKVNPDLVARGADGRINTVRYDAVNAMLLNEFLKEHKTVQELKKEAAALTATVKEQAAQVQKVSAQLEVSKPAPQMVLNAQ